jgi:hypothetical protein
MRAILFVSVLAGCASTHSTLTASAVQPNPRSRGATPDGLPSSEKLYIFEPTAMRHMRVHSNAQFTAVTRDLVRFHVGLSNGEFADQPGTADVEVWLEDEAGRRYEGRREAAHMKRMFHPQWRLPRDPRCPYRCARGYRDIWLRYATADFVFTAPGLLGPQRRSLVLNVVRPQDRHPLRFVWTFDDGTEIHHHYATPADEQDHRFFAVPRVDTMVRSDDAEAGTFSYR